MAAQDARKRFCIHLYAAHEHVSRKRAPSGLGYYEPDIQRLLRSNRCWCYSKLGYLRPHGLACQNGCISVDLPHILE